MQNTLRFHSCPFLVIFIKVPVMISVVDGISRSNFHHASSIDGSMVECAPPTRVIRVRFPVDARTFFSLDFLVSFIQSRHAVVVFFEFRLVVHFSFGPFVHVHFLALALAPSAVC